jgi:hypothetical protein
VAPGPAADIDTRAAALTQQLINAQNSLYNAQFQMTTIWITYLNTRDELYRDMELMPLDARGVWIDNVKDCECPPEAAGKQEPGAGELPAPRPEKPVGPELLPPPRPEETPKTLKPPEPEARLPVSLPPAPTEGPELTNRSSPAVKD